MARVILIKCFPLTMLELYQIHLSNMQYLYDEFEQSYVVFPKKKYLDEINSIDDVDWIVFNMMDRQDKGYSNQLGLMVEFELDEKFIEEQSKEQFLYWMMKESNSLIGVR